jgi:hypothetical protein
MLKVHVLWSTRYHYRCFRSWNNFRSHHWIAGNIIHSFIHSSFWFALIWNRFKYFFDIARVCGGLGMCQVNGIEIALKKHKLQGLVILNLPSYAAGMNLWGTQYDPVFIRFDSLIFILIQTHTHTYIHTHTNIKRNFSRDLHKKMICDFLFSIRVLIFQSMPSIYSHFCVFRNILQSQCLMVS